MKKIFPVLFCMTLITCFGRTECKAAKDKTGKTEINISMADGVVLSTDVYLPGKKGKYPAVLVRTPYDKSAEQVDG